MNFIQLNDEVHVAYLGAHKNMVVFTIKPKIEGWIVTSKLPSMKKEFGPYHSVQASKQKCEELLEQWLCKCSLKSICIE